MGVLRFFLALSVLVGHTGPGLYGLGSAPILLMNTIVAVNIFFIISGFYMSFVINEKYSALNRWIKTFYFSRLMRVFPSYIAIAAVTILYHFIIGRPDIFTNDFGMNSIARFFVIVPNIFLLGQDTLALIGDPALNQKILLAPQAWSLGVELLYYLIIAPFIATRRLWLALAIMSLSFAGRIYVVNLGTEFSSWSALFFPNLLVFFMLGHVAYLVYRKVVNLNSALMTGRLFSAGLTGFLTYNIVINKGIFIGAKHWDLPGIWLFYTVIAVAIPFIFILSKNSRFDFTIGQLSYPVYISHWLVIDFIGTFSSIPPASKPFYSLAATMILSIILYKLIESPVSKIKAKLVSVKKQQVVTVQ